MSFLNTQKAGLGLRQDFIKALLKNKPKSVDFFEIVPENWMKKGGAYKALLDDVAKDYPLVAHGLSLSIGGPQALNLSFLNDLKLFLDRYSIQTYSEHLSFTNSIHGNLFDLIPLPFTFEAARYVAERVNQVQDILNRPLVLENPSYYLTLDGEMSELDFILTVVEFSGAKLLLDVNNVYVNGKNHQYCPHVFIEKIPAKSISYCHVAGHFVDGAQVIDTHGSKVTTAVWGLLDQLYQQKGIIPTLLERDNEIPPFAELLDEVSLITKVQKNNARVCEFTN